MANDDVTPVVEPAEIAPVPVREPMTELKKGWRSACHPDQPCKVGDVTYPAPTKLDAADVLWWIDFTQTQVNASRNLLNGAISAVLGAMLGSLAAVVGVAVSGTPLVNALAGASGAVVIVVLVAWWLLRDSEHKPLEQRFLLYRQRARDLGVL